MYVKDVQVLLEKLSNMDCSGLVLEVPKVMKAGRRNRDRLFAHANCRPVLRTRPNTRHGFMIYLDPREVFFENIKSSEGLRRRNFERIPVEMTCQIAHEDDPSMVEVVDGTIHDISPRGCFLKAPPVFRGEAFVNLRIPDLGNSRPIYASVRWSRSEPGGENLVGMGLFFIDLTDDQAQAIINLG